MAPASILSLDTLAERSTVRIDGDAYELLPPDALSVLHYRRLSVLIPRIEMLWGVETPTEVEGVELQDAFDELSRMVLRAPPAVLDRLTTLQHVLIYQAFWKLPHETLLRVGALMRARGTQTAPTAKVKKSSGAKRSRASRASTEVTPSSGSPASHSPSSEPAL